MTGTRPLEVLHVALRPSRVLAGVLAVGHFGAIGCAWLTIPSAYAAALASGLLVVHAGAVIRRHALRQGARAIVGLRLRSAEDCIVLLGAGGEHPCRIGPDSYVCPWLMVLQIRRTGWRFSSYLVIVPDACASDVLRRLRVRLRWSNGASGAGADTSL